MTYGILPSLFTFSIAVANTTAQSIRKSCGMLRMLTQQSIDSWQEEHGSGDVWSRQFLGDLLKSRPRTVRVETYASALSSALSRVLTELMNGESDENNEQIFAGRSTVRFSVFSVFGFGRDSRR